MYVFPSILIKFLRIFASPDHIWRVTVSTGKHFKFIFGIYLTYKTLEQMLLIPLSMRNFLSAPGPDMLMPALIHCKGPAITSDPAPEPTNSNINKFAS